MSSMTPEGPLFQVLATVLESVKGALFLQRHSQTQAHTGICQGINFFCPTISNIIFFRKIPMVYGVFNQRTFLLNLQ